MALKRRRENDETRKLPDMGKALDWDTPYVHPTGTSNKDLMAAKDAKTAARNKANDAPMAPVTFSKPDMTNDPHKYRLTSYGDD
jgi:hypothetical protein